MHGRPPRHPGNHHLSRWRGRIVGHPLKIKASVRKKTHRSKTKRRKQNKNKRRARLATGAPSEQTDIYGTICRYTRTRNFVTIRSGWRGAREAERGVHRDFLRVSLSSDRVPPRGRECSIQNLFRYISYEGPEGKQVMKKTKSGPGRIIAPKEPHDGPRTGVSTKYDPLPYLITKSE